MTDAVQEPVAPKSKRKPRVKDNSLAVMKELTGLMGQRTTIINQLRAKRAEVAQLEASLQELANEIQWRAGVFGLATQPSSGAPSPQIQTPGQPQPVMTMPIFRAPEPPANASGVNRGYADLNGLT